MKYKYHAIGNKRPPLNKRYIDIWADFRKANKRYIWISDSEILMTISDHLARRRRENFELFGHLLGGFTSKNIKIFMLISDTFISPKFQHANKRYIEFQNPEFLPSNKRPPSRNWLNIIFFCTKK